MPIEIVDLPNSKIMIFHTCVPYYQRVDGWSLLVSSFFGGLLVCTQNMNPNRKTCWVWMDMAVSENEGIPVYLIPMDSHHFPHEKWVCGSISVYAPVLRYPNWPLVLSSHPSVTGRTLSLPSLPTCMVFNMNPPSLVGYSLEI